jgi:hypothetical protein
LTVNVILISPKPLELHFLVEFAIVLKVFLLGLFVVRLVKLLATIEQFFPPISVNSFQLVVGHTMAGKILQILHSLCDAILV